MDDSYFYTFKIHFEWEDREKEIITCSCGLAVKEKSDLNKQVALMRINLKDDKIHYLSDENFDIKMSKDDFRNFIWKSAKRWVEKQLDER